MVQHSYASLDSWLETFSRSSTNVHACLTYKTKSHILNVIFAVCKYDLYENLWMLRLWEFWEWSSSLTHLFPWAHALTVSFSIFYYFLCELIFILLCLYSVVFVWWIWTFEYSYTSLDSWLETFSRSSTNVYERCNCREVDFTLMEMLLKSHFRIVKLVETKL